MAVKSIFNCVLFTKNGIFGIVFNLIVIIVMLKSKDLMVHPSSKFIINQSAIDIVASIAVLLSYGNIVAGYGLSLPTYLDDSVTHDFFCKVWHANYFMWAFIQASTSNLVILTIERFMKIVFAKWYSAHIGRKTIIGLLILPWLIGPVYQAALFITVSDVKNNKCKHHIWPSEAVQKGIGGFSFVFQFLVPIIIMVICYVSMLIFIVRRQRKNRNTGDDELSTETSSELQTKTDDLEMHEKKNGYSNGLTGSYSTKDVEKKKYKQTKMAIIKLLFIVSLAFFFCWVFNQVMFLLVNTNTIAWSSVYGKWFYYLQIYLAFCNCWINPLIYVIVFKSFRDSMFSMCTPRN